MKDALSQARLLYHPVPEAPLAIRSDASYVSMGTVLEQLLAGEWCLLGFFTHSLMSTELGLVILHAISHPGVRASQQLVGDRFVWHGLHKNIAA